MRRRPTEAADAVGNGDRFRQPPREPSATRAISRLCRLTLDKASVPFGVSFADRPVYAVERLMSRPSRRRRRRLRRVQLIRGRRRHFDFRPRRSEKFLELERRRIRPSTRPTGIVFQFRRRRLRGRFIVVAAAEFPPSR